MCPSGLFAVLSVNILVKCVAILALWSICLFPIGHCPPVMLLTTSELDGAHSHLDEIRDSRFFLAQFNDHNVYRDESFLPKRLLVKREDKPTFWQKTGSSIKSYGGKALKSPWTYVVGMAVTVGAAIYYQPEWLSKLAFWRNKDQDQKMTFNPIIVGSGGGANPSLNTKPKPFHIKPIQEGFEMTTNHWLIIAIVVGLSLLIGIFIWRSQSSEQPVMEQDNNAEHRRAKRVRRKKDRKRRRKKTNKKRRKKR